MSTRTWSTGARSRCGSIRRRKRPATPPERPAFAPGRALARLLPAPLFRPEKPLRYVVLAWAIAFVPSVALTLIVALILPAAARPAFPYGSAVAFAMIVVASPIGESLIMGLALEGLRRLAAPPFAVGLSALGWGLAHSLLAPAWGLVIWWPFLIFSIVFLTWRGRGFVHAAAMAAAVHGLHNLGPAVALLASR